MVSLTGSAMAMIPATWSSTPTKTTVAPSARSRSASTASGPGSTPVLGQEAGAAEQDPPVLHRPDDALAGRGVEVGDVRDRSARRSAAALTTATPRGCSDARSTPAASRRSSFSSSPAAGTIAVTDGLPSVRVPVLSTTRVSTFSITSSASAFLIRTPRPAPRPTPTMIDMGVASPSAQGQAMIRTDTATINACARRGSGPTRGPDDERRRRRRR